MAGVDASKISPVNPFEKSGGTATLLQGAVAEVNPEQAAKWRVAAGGSLSIATLAEMQTGQQCEIRRRMGRRDRLNGDLT